MAKKYQAYSDALFESDDETEFDEAREEAKDEHEDDNEDKDEHEEADLVEKGSAMVNQVSKEEALRIMQTDETNLDFTFPKDTLKGLVEKEDGELGGSCSICGKNVLLFDKHILVNHGGEVK